MISSTIDLCFQRHSRFQDLTVYECILKPRTYVIDGTSDVLNFVEQPWQPEVDLVIAAK